MKEFLKMVFFRNRGSYENYLKSKEMKGREKVMLKRLQMREFWFHDLNYVVIVI